MTKQIQTFFKCLISPVCVLALLASSLRAEEVNHYPKNDLDGMSPKGAFIKTQDDSVLSIFDSVSLKKRFEINAKTVNSTFFTSDEKHLVYVDRSVGLQQLNLSNGKVITLAQLPFIDEIYALGGGGSLIIQQKDRNGNNNTKMRIYLLESGKAPALLHEYEVESGERFGWFAVLPHKDADKILIEVRDEIPADSHWEDSTYSPTRFYELNIVDGSSQLLSTFPVEPDIGYELRQAPNNSELFEYTLYRDGSYNQLNPYSGEIVRHIEVEGVKFQLDKDGLVSAERKVTENGQEKTFIDFMESGTLRTIRNIDVTDYKGINLSGKQQVFNAAPETLWFSRSHTITQFSEASNSVVGEYQTEHNFAQVLGVSVENPDHLILQIQYGELNGKTVVRYDTLEGKVIVENLNALPEKFHDFAFHPKRPEFFATDESGNVHLYRVGRSGLNHSLLGKSAYSVNYSPSGDFIFSADVYESGLIRSSPESFPVLGEDAVFYSSDPPHTMYPVYADGYDLSSSGKWIIQRDSVFAYLCKADDRAVVSKIEQHGFRYGNDEFYTLLPVSYAITQNDTGVIRLSLVKRWNEETEKSSYTATLKLFLIDDIDSEYSDFPETEWTVDLPHTRWALLGSSADSKTVRLLDENTGSVVEYSVATGEIESTVPTDLIFAESNIVESGFHETVKRVSHNPSKTTVLIGKSRLHFLRYESGQLNTHTLQLDEGIESLKMLGGGRLLAGITSSGEVKLIRFSKDSEPVSLGKLSFYNAGEDYLIQAAAGQFDASPAVLDNGYYKQGNALMPLAQIFDQSFEPNLLAKMFEGVELPEAPVDIEQVTRAPVGKLKLITKDRLNYEVTVTAMSDLGKLRDVLLYHNEKLVKSFAIVNQTTFQGEQMIRLVPGENTIKLIAVSEYGISSVPVSRVITPDESVLKALEEASKSSGVSLHMLVVGINKYQNNRYNLNYALSDAKSMLEAIDGGGSALFDKIHTYTLFDKDATSGNIIAEFDKVRAAARPQDVFVFYFAGHGVMSKDTNQFYIVPADVTQIYGQSESLATNGISSSTLRSMAERIAAQKQLFILDACNSGGALETFNTRGASQEKAIAQLARATGTHWITASSSSQFATEFDHLGHGAFTYTMLRGLMGEADSGDERITINELKAFIESELPKVTKEHKGTPQYPASYGYGRDFPITMVK